MPFTPTFPPQWRVRITHPDAATRDAALEAVTQNQLLGDVFAICERPDLDLLVAQVYYGPTGPKDPLRTAASLFDWWPPLSSLIATVRRNRTIPPGVEVIIDSDGATFWVTPRDAGLPESVMV